MWGQPPSAVQSGEPRPVPSSRGRTYVVTSHGRPVARISPVLQKQGKVGDSPSWSRLLRRVGKQRVMNIGRWTRDELYD